VPLPFAMGCGVVADSEGDTNGVIEAPVEDLYQAIHATVNSIGNRIYVRVVQGHRKQHRLSQTLYLPPVW
jgi:hypothetical protein